MLKRIYCNKGVPKTFLGEWRSIEFELIFNSSKDLTRFVKFVEDSGYDAVVTVKYDGSIAPRYNNYDEQDREVVVSYPKGKEQIVRDICKFLKGKAYVNASCGTHVHFDMRGIKRDRVLLYGKRLAQAVPALKKILPHSRRESEYCWRSINSLDSGDRYAFVNMLAYKEHKTIEIRGHSGTLNASKILNWIKLLDFIMHSEEDLSKTRIRTPKQLIECYKLDEKLTAFVKKRELETNPELAPPPPAEQPVVNEQAAIGGTNV